MVDKQIFGLTQEANPLGTHMVAIQKALGGDFFGVELEDIVAKYKVTAQGDLLVASAAGTLARLGIGTAGQVLTVNAGATSPEWADPSGDLLASDLRALSLNLIKNYPSMELADGVQPEFWSSSNCTLTEEDATGELFTSGQPNERILKGVTSAVNGSIYQELDLTAERILNPANTVSGGVLVRTASAGTLRLRLWDDSGGYLPYDEVTTTTTGAWTRLNLLSQVLSSSATKLRFEIDHSANGATFYAANPQLNLGSIVGPFSPRVPVYKHIDGGTVVVTAVDPGGATQTQSFQSASSPNAVLLNIEVLYINPVTSGRIFKVGRSGHGVTNWLTGHAAGGIRTIGFVMCDDQQQLDYSTSAPAGEAETVYIILLGYYEW